VLVSVCYFTFQHFQVEFFGSNVTLLNTAKETINSLFGILILL
jgi:hypothetical protein